MKLHTTLFLVAVALLGTSRPARAEFPEILAEPTEHAMWATLSLGPGIGMYRSGSQFKLIQTFGFHFLRKPSGPAIAMDLAESVGGGYVLIDIAPRFVWDIRLIEGLGVFLSPSAGLGFSHGTAAGCATDHLGNTICATAAWNAFHMPIAFEGKLVLANRWLVSFRPFGLDIYAFSGGAALRYNILFGGGAIF